MYDKVETNESLIGNIEEFLAFKLGGEEYGIDILNVQEIRSYESPTRIANAQSFVLGLINLRGVIVPILDMRIKFNLPDVNYDSFTVVIVVSIGKKVIGMVVDGVSDVIKFTPEQLHRVPKIDSAIPNYKVLAIGSIENRTLMLLDIANLLDAQEKKEE